MAFPVVSSLKRSYEGDQNQVEKKRTVPSLTERVSQYYTELLQEMLKCLYSQSLKTINEEKSWQKIKDLLSRREVLEDPNFDINTTLRKNSSDNINALQLALRMTDWPFVSFLVMKYPRLNVDDAPSDDPGCTALVMVALHKKLDLVLSILEKHPSAKVEVASKETAWQGMTVLWVSASHKRWDVVKKILKIQPSVNVNTVADFAREDKQYFLLSRMQTISKKLRAI